MAIPATFTIDDINYPAFDLDVEPWFGQAEDGELLDLFLEQPHGSLGNSEKGDHAAHWMVQYNARLNDLFRVCAILDKGYTLTIDDLSAAAWVRQHKPELMEEIDAEIRAACI